MSNTNFSDSHPAGHELFSDSESYMTPLSSDETDSIHGGEEPFNDVGDVVGYSATILSASVAVATTGFTSTWGCSVGAVAASVEAFDQAHD